MQAQVRRVVTKIDANPILAKQNDENGLLRVAAYCRVSTDITLNSQELISIINGLDASSNYRIQIEGKAFKKL